MVIYIYLYHCIESDWLQGPKCKVLVILTKVKTYLKLKLFASFYWDPVIQDKFKSKSKIIKITFSPEFLNIMIDNSFWNYMKWNMWTPN